MYKIYNANFKTNDITAEDIRKTYDFGMPSDEVLEQEAKAQRDLDGVQVQVSEWDYSPGAFSLMSWQDEDDSKIKELLWSIEQAGGFYCDDRTRFDKDWAKGEYDPGGALHFSKELFDNIELVKEVINYKVFAVGIDRMEYIAAITSDEALQDHLKRAEYDEEELKEVTVSKVSLDSVWAIEQETGGYKDMTIEEYLKDFYYKEPTVIGADA